MPVLWYASRSKVSKTNWLIGDASCPPGASDCNRCAVTVPEQFADVLHDGQATWANRPWDFHWSTSYGPNNLTPSDVFDDANVAQHTHIQGFVRTNSAQLPYAASHSDNDIGGIMIIQRHADGRKKLHAIHAARGPHPSGLHTIGKYVAFTEEGELGFIDITRHAERQSVRYAIVSEGELGGGGIGLAKLRGGGHLLLTAKQGGSHETRSQFYFVDGPLESLRRIDLLREEDSLKWRVKLANENPVLGNPVYGSSSENISLITECATGTLYAIHSTGSGNTSNNIGDSGGVWRLSRVDWDSSGPTLTPIDYAWFTQNRSNCHLRSADTVHPDGNNRLVFYCHERARQEPLLPANYGDSFTYREGVAYE